MCMYIYIMCMYIYIYILYNTYIYIYIHLQMDFPILPPWTPDFEASAWKPWNLQPIALLQHVAYPNSEAKVLDIGWKIGGKPPFRPLLDHFYLLFDGWRVSPPGSWFKYQPTMPENCTGPFSRRSLVYVFNHGHWPAETTQDFLKSQLIVPI